MRVFELYNAFTQTLRGSARHVAIGNVLAGQNLRIFGLGGGVKNLIGLCKLLVQKFCFGGKSMQNV